MFFLQIFLMKNSIRVKIIDLPAGKRGNGRREIIHFSIRNLYSDVAFFFIFIILVILKFLLK